MRVSLGVFGLMVAVGLMGCGMDQPEQEAPVTAPAQQAGEVHLVGHRFVPLDAVDPEHLAPATTYGLRVSLAYFAPGNVTQDFDVILRAEDGDLFQWNLRDEDTGKLLGNAQDGEGVAIRVSGVSSDGTPAVARIRFETPAMGDATLRALTLAVAVRAATPHTQLGDDLPRPIQLVVRP